MRIGNDFRLRYNSELYELLNDMNVVQRINIQRLHWLRHVVRMEEDAPARRVFDAVVYGREFLPEICGEEIAEEILISFGFDVWLNPGFTSNKLTHYLLDYGDFISIYL